MVVPLLRSNSLGSVAFCREWDRLPDRILPSVLRLPQCDSVSNVSISTVANWDLGCGGRLVWEHKLRPSLFLSSNDGDMSW